jgi:argininosuccinate synthase
LHRTAKADRQDFEAAREKAMKCGAAGFYVEDLKREFVEELIYRKLHSPVRLEASSRPAAVQCNAIYEGVYLLGTSLARPVIARGMMEVAIREGCE